MDKPLKDFTVKKGKKWNRSYKPQALGCFSLQGASICFSFLLLAGALRGKDKEGAITTHF